jgi:hypothetical protein
MKQFYQEKSMNKFNHIKIIFMGMLVVSTAGIRAANEMPGFNIQFNINKILELAKEFARKIKVSGNLNETINSLYSEAQKNLDNLPSTLLGININALIKTGQIDQNTRALLKMTIDEATTKLPTIITFLQFPDLIIQIFENIVYPQLITLLNRNGTTEATNIIAAIRSALDFAKTNKDAVTNISQRIAELLTVLQKGLEQLRNQDLTTLNATTLTTTFNDLKNKFEQEYTVIFPIIVKFVQDHGYTLQDLLQKISAMNINIDLQKVIRHIQSELAPVTK